jgi:hypothetical protein
MPLTRSRARRAPAPVDRRLAGAAALGLAVTCGGRTELEVPPPLPPQPECLIDEDCPNHDDLCSPVRCVDPADYQGLLPELPLGVPLPPLVCVVLEEAVCDDNDPCTEDTCDGDTGLCSYGPSTLDLDGDGHNAPLLGTTPGEPGSCGDDCNDASDKAFPGNDEICDGVDNDCNGIVDDGATFVPDTPAVQVSSDGIAPAGPGGLAFNGDSYLSVYWGTSSGFDMYETQLLPDGTKIDPIEEKFTFQNADSAGGPMVWIGDRYGVAWQDRRDGNYEIYFTLLNESGAKAIADTRLSFAPDFSVNPTLAWNGLEFVVAWQDSRSGAFTIYGQRIDVDGVPIGSNVEMSLPMGLEDEAPQLAAGKSTLGLAYVNGLAGIQTVLFRTFEHDTLEAHTDIIQLSDGITQAVYPVVVWNEDRYLVAWFDRSGPTKAIFGATIDEEGNVLDSGPLSDPGSANSRYPSLLPLGDRALVVFSDDRDGNQGYELYTRMITRELGWLTPEQRVTDAPFDSIYPVATFGPDGDVGVLFRDDRNGGDHHVWFTRLGCLVP